MNFRRMAGWRGLLAGVLLAVAASAAPAAANKWGADYFPDVVLTTQDGRQVHFYEDLVKGKSVAVNVIYTSCVDECPLETARLAEVQRLLAGRVGRDVWFYSISIDPERDTPKVLKAYAARFGVGPGWLFLTGRKQDIQLLTRKLGLSRTSDAFSKDGHASSLMLGDDRGGQWMRTSSVDNPRFLATTMASFFQWKDALPTQDYGQARVVDISKSQYLFESRCSSCHTMGAGDRIGPDLLNVTQRRDAAWLARYLKEPERVLAERDPTAVALSKKYGGVPMPNLSLGEDDVRGLVAWLAQQSRAATSAGASPNAGAGNAQHHHHNAPEPRR
ncbi:MAG TPA: SCO family protein [Ramlibacter sp.]|uniref:SCO family protein n=1 Tax=Ramlibacter sp. TaxID=1917967 RepID=UPI002ED627B9